MKINELRNNKEYIKTLRRVIKLMDSKPGTPEFKELATLLLLLKKYDQKHSPKAVPELIS